MYLRHSTVRKNGKAHTYWRLVHSVRTARKIRHETVACLGELDAQGGAKASDVDRFRARVMAVGRETIPWADVAFILVAARLCEPSSELRVAEDWYRRTAVPASGMKACPRYTEDGAPAIAPPCRARCERRT